MFSSVKSFVEEHHVLILLVILSCSVYYLYRFKYRPPFIPDVLYINPETKKPLLSAEEMKNKALCREVFSDEELDSTVRSFQYAAGNFTNKILYSYHFDMLADSSDDEIEQVDWMCLRGILRLKAHQDYSDWDVTERSADLITELIGTPDTSEYCNSLLHRVLEDGGWQTAEVYANARISHINQLINSRDGSSSRSNKHGLIRCHKPWVVVICGLNGIRKTTSVYQSWFQELLESALGSQFMGDMITLPCGDNSFFRQLDFIMAAIACESFREMYSSPSIGDVLNYCRQKDAVYARYRTLAEMIGIMLVKQAREKGMNIMMETTGKSIASFNYIDCLFPNNGSSREYNKLLVHYTIDDIKYAKQSVDRRMVMEMERGFDTIRSMHNVNEEHIRNIISVNCGGPYGSNMLADVLRESDEVMSKVFCPGNCAESEEEDDRYASWFKARVRINASESGWYACSLSSEGKELKRFPFEANK